MTVTKIEYATPGDLLLRPCSPVEMQFKTNGELLMSLIELNTQYQICSARMNAVIEYFEKLKILNEEP